MSKLFWAMLSFITRLPVPRRWSQGLDFEHYSRGIITFPLIGLLLQYPKPPAILHLPQRPAADLP
ncbi:hypothetical protein ACUODJ_04875, partial [Escherichia sp. HC-CC]